MSWIVAFNIHTKEWSTGGAASIYDPAHWDRYNVHAMDRIAAEKAARELRKKQSRLTQPQKDLISAIYATFKDDGNPLTSRVTVDPDEIPAARQLEGKGILTFHEATQEVTLSLAGLNFRRDIPAKAAA